MQKSRFIIFFHLFLTSFLVCFATEDKKNKTSQDFYLASLYLGKVSADHPYAREGSRGSHFAEVNILVREDVDVIKGYEAIKQAYPSSLVYLWNQSTHDPGFNLKLSTIDDQINTSFKKEVMNKPFSYFKKFVWSFSIFRTKKELQTLLDGSDTTSIYYYPLKYMDKKTSFRFAEEQRKKSLIFVDSNGMIQWTTLKAYLAKMPDSSSPSKKLANIYALDKKKMEDDCVACFRVLEERYNEEVNKNEKKSNDSIVHTSKIKNFFIIVIVLAVLGGIIFLFGEEEDIDWKEDDFY